MTIENLEKQNKIQLRMALDIAGVHRSPFLIHYGSDKFIPEKVLPIENDWVKPKGGLWTSPVDSKWGWKDWNESEQFVECDERNSFTLCLKPDINIFVIDSLEDLKNSPLIDWHFSKKILDFELIAQSYDAIWLTENGLNETHLSFPISLYGWDCETVLVLNSECCSVVS
jgi:hypothetical protein